MATVFLRRKEISRFLKGKEFIEGEDDGFTSFITGNDDLFAILLGFIEVLGHILPKVSEGDSSHK
jgi:hypothetical protein